MTTTALGGRGRYRAAPRTDTPQTPTRPPRGPLRGARAGGWRRALTILYVAACGAAALCLGGTAATYAYFSRDLPSPAAIGERHQFQTTKIYDRNGVLLHEVYDPNKGKREALGLSQIPEHVRQAFLAAEDARFYENSGIDFQAIVRAFFTNATSRGERLAGGSTITQQLVKYSLLTDERTLPRKIREAILAIRISRTYSKDQILEMYLNSAFFGNQAYGIEAASETYFAKPAQELSQAEATLLAGIVRSPSSTNPFKDQEAAKNEQKRVLEQMVKHRMVSQDQADALAAEPLNYNTKQFSELKAPHFAIWIREQLESNPKYGQQGLYQRGLEITTTLDFRMQEMAELLVREHVSKLGRYNASDAALVSINPATGEILAMVGSADYNNKEIKGEVNVALAPRQPGSSIKPITYLTALHKGWTPGTIIEDIPTTFPSIPPFTPKNYDGTFRGKVTVRQALAMSLNIPAVKALQHVGVPAMIEQARKMGITTFQDPSRYGLALTLGGGEVRLLDLVGAYGVFANGGQYVQPVSILKVTDTQGNVLDQWTGPQPKPATDTGRAYMITSILSDNAARAPAFGANSPLRLRRPVAVKTGTTDDYKDNWTIGYTSQLVTGVWVGNADNRAMRGTTGLTGAAPIWHDFMEYALAPLPVDPLAPPEGLVKLKVDRNSGKLWQEGCEGEAYEDFFAPGAEPKEQCEVPTPAPTLTPAPASPTPAVTATPRPENTATPTTDELRERLQATQAAVATSDAQRQPTQPPAQPTQSQAQPTSPPATPAPTQTAQRQPTQAPAQPTQAPAATSTQPATRQSVQPPAQPTAAPAQPTTAPAATATRNAAPTATETDRRGRGN